MRMRVDESQFASTLIDCHQTQAKMRIKVVDSPDPSRVTTVKQEKLSLTLMKNLGMFKVGDIAQE